MPNQSEIKRLLNREPQMIQAAFKKSRERIKDQPLEGAEARQLVRSIAVMVAEVADLPLPRILKFFGTAAWHHFDDWKS